MLKKPYEADLDKRVEPAISAAIGEICRSDASCSAR
jgi:hypothetical protein